MTAVVVHLMRGCTTKGDHMSDRLNLIGTIAKDPKFSTFSRLLESSGTKELIEGEGTFTVFAPTNDAFAKLPEQSVLALTNQAGQADLRNLLAFHIIPGKLMSADLPRRTSAKTVLGPEINFTDMNGLRVNGSGIQARNIEATNGVVHALETVLAAPAAASAATAAAGATTAPAITATPPMEVSPKRPATIL